MNIKKIHPLLPPKNPDVINLLYDVVVPPPPSSHDQRKKLRRLPHIFSKVLALPFHPDTPVSIRETQHSLTFSVPTRDVIGGDDITAESIEIYPGVVKLVLRARGVVCGDQLDMYVWRSRLPDSTRPEMASVAYVDGELMVVVPKVIDDGLVGGGGGDRVVLVR